MTIKCMKKPSNKALVGFYVPKDITPTRLYAVLTSALIVVYAWEEKSEDLCWDIPKELKGKIDIAFGGGEEGYGRRSHLFGIVVRWRGEEKE